MATSKPLKADTGLNVRNLDPAVKTRLRSRAQRHGRSMEAEVRAILAHAVDEDDSATVNPLSGAALLARLAELRETLDGDVPEFGVRHKDS